MSRTYRVRLPQALAEQPEQVCADVHLPVSAAIRLAVAHALNDPAGWQIFQRALPFNQVDTARLHRYAPMRGYEVEAAKFDMGTICREQGLV